MDLTFTVDGREALPVRAIPWVAGAETFPRKLVLPPSLIVLSARTACDSKDANPGAPLLRFYRYDRGSVQPVTAVRLDATAPECDFQPEADEPLRESTRRLPAGTFVFLDELRSFVDWIYPPGSHDGECRDAVALDTSPDVPAEMIEWLQEGCVAPEPNSAGNRLSHRKILFWLSPNEILIPADQVPGAIADALYPRPDRNGGIELNDTDTVPRLLTGCELVPGETALQLARPKLSYCAPQEPLFLVRDGYSFRTVEKAADERENVGAIANQVWQLLMHEMGQGRYHSANTLEAIARESNLTRQQIRSGLGMLRASLRIEERAVPEHAGKGGRHRYLHPVASPKHDGEATEKTEDDSP